MGEHWTRSLKRFVFGVADDDDCRKLDRLAYAKYRDGAHVLTVTGESQAKRLGYRALADAAKAAAAKDQPDA